MLGCVRSLLYGEFQPFTGETTIEWYWDHNQFRTMSGRGTHLPTLLLVVYLLLLH